MIEEIKLLIPLLESTQEGTFWLIIIYFGITITEMFMVSGLVLYLIMKLYNLMIVGMGGNIGSMFIDNTDSELVTSLLKQYHTSGSNYIHPGEAKILQKVLQRGVKTR